MNIIGIDPGATGALASYNGEELLIYDMPVHGIKKGKSVRKRIDIIKLLEILANEKPDHIYIEQVSAQPGNGAASAFSFGWACAVVEACAVALKLPFTYVTSQRWKKEMSCPAEKDAARMRASQLFPKFAHNWDRKKDHGRAEAALISLYGWQKSG